MLPQEFKMRLSVTYLGQDISLNSLTQTVPFIIKLVDVRFNGSYPPNPESLTTSELTVFSVFQKNTQKTYQTIYYTSKL